jgi:DNA-binding YbaB/EbfC family protein
MFKGLGNLASMMKQAQEMQGRMSEMREQLGQMRVEASTGAGLVRVEASGHQKILAVHIDDSVLEDREMVEELLVAAVNQALEKSQDLVRDQMSQLTGDMNIPGLAEALSKMGLDGTPGV